MPDEDDHGSFLDIAHAVSQDVPPHARLLPGSLLLALHLVPSAGRNAPRHCFRHLEVVPVLRAVVEGQVAAVQRGALSAEVRVELACVCAQVEVGRESKLTLSGRKVGSIRNENAYIMFA